MPCRRYVAPGGSHLTTGLPIRVCGRRRRVTEEIDTGGCSVPAAVPAWRTELPDLVEVVAVSRQWRCSFAFPLSIPGLHQDHQPALAERYWARFWASVRS